jgi:hypothetical protein
MISLAMVRIVVVADEDIGERFARTLRRMGFAEVRRVASEQAAREFCNAQHADACLVLLSRAVPDELPRWTVEAAAPGVGIPSLLVADVVTPYVVKRARSSGYVAAVAAASSPRLLYRHICALVQKARRAEDSHRAASAPASRAAFDAALLDGDFDKLKLQ